MDSISVINLLQPWRIYARISNYDTVESLSKVCAGLGYKPYPGLVNFVPVVAYRFCLNLLAAFSHTTCEWTNSPALYDGK